MIHPKVRHVSLGLSSSANDLSCQSGAQHSQWFSSSRQTRLYWVNIVCVYRQLVFPSGLHPQLELLLTSAARTGPSRGSRQTYRDWRSTNLSWSSSRRSSATRRREMPQWVVCCGVSACLSNQSVPTVYQEKGNASLFRMEHVMYTPFLVMIWEIIWSRVSLDPCFR